MPVFNTTTSSQHTHNPIVNNHNEDNRIVNDPITGITYNDQELSDPDLISVSIDDEDTPIVVLFGPPQCGKSMIMLRLAEYLLGLNKGYTVNPVRSFRPAHDTNYRNACDTFKQKIYSKWAAEKNAGLDFMLVEISHNGNPVVQILEAPGESYYDDNNPYEPTKEFPRYVQQTIINSPSRKIWLFITEPNWKNIRDRMGYVSKINLPALKRKTRGKNSSVVIFNKVDDTTLFDENGHVNKKAAVKFVNGQYKGLFNTFKNPNPISSLWRKYNCRFVPFQTGTYREVLDQQTNTMKLSYTAGEDLYPCNLWKIIMDMVKGK